MSFQRWNELHLETADANLSRLIATVLTLGDINLVDYSITWLNGLLENYGFHTFLARQFHDTYR
jgi:hypothetical protein